MDAINDRKRIKQHCNVQFYQTLNSKARIKVHQGGTRSGKTYAICQYLIYKLTSTKEPLIISIVRKTLPAIKGSVQRDFLEILDDIGILFVGNHNKSENTYTFGNHIVEFLSVDEPQKIRGRKRNICFINEGNELNFEDYQQLLMRTEDEMIIDFNPSDPIHWIYDHVITREDCDTWITTYNDNKFLPQELVNEIERLKARDPDYWRVYGEGQRAVFSDRQIFTNWNFIPYADFPEFDDVSYGLDFGFSQDPTAIVQVARVNDKLYIHEICYKKGMTNRDIADFIKEKKLNDHLFYCDSAEPKSIEELRQMDMLAKPAIKGEGSIKAGIGLIKEHDVYVSIESKNMAKEYQYYFWEQLKDGTIINKPIDKQNHCFVGSTLIKTINGNVPIEDIKVGDYVATSTGYKKVLLKHNNGKKRVFEYLMQFGTNSVYLSCTNNHQIKTDTGWTEIGQLKQNQNLFLHRNLTENHIIYMKVKDIIAKGLKDCTGLFGNILMALFPKAMTYITKTMIRLIIKLKIYHWLAGNCIKDLPAFNVLRKIRNGLKSFIQMVLRLQKNGTNQMKGNCGTQIMQKKCFQKENIKIVSANNAEMNTKHGIWEFQNFAIQTAKLRHYEQGGSWIEEVYDITVEDDHEYFANGILVHNCMDALRYCVYTKYKNRNDFFVI